MLTKADCLDDLTYLMNDTIPVGCFLKLYQLAFLVQFVIYTQTILKYSRHCSILVNLDTN